MEKIFRIAVCGDAWPGKCSLPDNAHRLLDVDDVRFHLSGHRGQCSHSFITACAEADCVLIVVDAAHGIQDHTFCYYRYCRMLGVPHVLFAVTSAEMADEKSLDALADEIRSTFVNNEVLMAVAVRYRLLELARADSNNRLWALFVQDNILTPGNRAVTGIETGTCDPSQEVRVYPSAMPCRMSQAICNTFVCDRDVPISHGNVITNAQLSVGNELHGHLLSFADELPQTLLVKIGTDSAYVKEVSLTRIVLRKQLAYADSAVLRGLSYGILIDHITKLTVGMFVIGRGKGSDGGYINNGTAQQ